MDSTALKYLQMLITLFSSISLLGHAQCQDRVRSLTIQYGGENYVKLNLSEFKCQTSFYYIDVHNHRESWCDVFIHLKINPDAYSQRVLWFTMCKIWGMVSPGRRPEHCTVQHIQYPFQSQLYCAEESMTTEPSLRHRLFFGIMSLGPKFKQGWQ